MHQFLATVNVLPLEVPDIGAPFLGDRCQLVYNNAINAHPV